MYKPEPATPLEIVEMLREVSVEITRINRAAGQTVFNPAATSALRSILWRIEKNAAPGELTPAPIPAANFETPPEGFPFETETIRRVPK